ncbi:hypothetical protein Y032_0213g2275 [Ancylostoma ceylanicum]|uniref:Uncharacterized protein n=1 Tax=Ancylostoma ceylanicum TaxID=53326 RepID=A0A016SKE3_9BILA|nr:hypothetical protein Y032_0213g2275 [Ancylostoma ceylanicum]
MVPNVGLSPRKWSVELALWMAGITRPDRICSQDIRHLFGVRAMDDILSEARLRWFGHVLRAEGEEICRTGFELDVPGKQKDERRNNGLALCIPIPSWLGSITTRPTIGQYGAEGSAKRTPLPKRENAAEEEDQCTHRVPRHFEMDAIGGNSH